MQIQFLHGGDNGSNVAKMLQFHEFGGIIFEQTKVNFQVPLQDNRFVPRSSV